MDQQTLIAQMNEDLGLEYRSMIQYIQHVATIKGLEAQSLVQEMRAYLGQKLQHALQLAEQIAFLGGVSSVAVPAVPNETDMKPALELDLQIETQLLERYRERIEQATELGLLDVAEALRPLLVQTQEHVRELQSALGQ